MTVGGYPVFLYDELYHHQANKLGNPFVLPAETATEPMCRNTITWSFHTDSVPISTVL